MRKVPGSTEVNFLFRPVGFRIPQGRKATVREIESWRDTKKPHFIKNLPNLSIGEIVALVVALVSEIIGLKNDNKNAKWGGVILGLLNIGTHSIGMVYRYFTEIKDEEAATKSFLKQLDEIKDEHSQENKDKLRKKLLEEYNQPEIADFLFGYVTRNNVAPKYRTEFAYLLKLTNDKTIIGRLLSVLSDKDKRSDIREAADVALGEAKDTSVLETYRSILKDKNDSKQIRGRIASNLRNVDGKETYDLLVECFHDKEDDIDVRMSALDSLVHRKESEVRQLIADSLKNDEPATEKTRGVNPKIHILLKLEHINWHEDGLPEPALTALEEIASLDPRLLVDKSPKLRADWVIHEIKEKIKSKQS